MNDPIVKNEESNFTRKLPDFLSGDLPKKKKDLEALLKNLYEKLYSPRTGYPDWSRDNPIKERIEQAKFEISRIDAKSVKKREFIFLILAIVGTAFGVLSFIFKQA